MRSFILKRVAAFVPQLLFLAIAVFTLLRLLPVDPVSRLIGSFNTDQNYATAERTLGLDRGFGEQLGEFLGGLPSLDFGTSWRTGDSVAAELAERVPVTLQLVVLSFVVALAIAVPLGRYVAAHVGGRVERIVTGYAMFAGAQPDFWWALIFVYVFYFLLGIAPAPLGLSVPVEGPTNFVLIDTLLHGDLAAFRTAVSEFALPVLTLAFTLTGPILKIARQSAMDALSSDYVLHARAMGVPQKSISRMITRNSLSPVVTIVGVLFVFTLGGAVLVESVFSLNGLGRYALSSVLEVDFPAIQGAALVMAFLGLTVYVLMDVLYALLDPRVRFPRR